jgi:hypothetical protein
MSLLKQPDFRLQKASSENCEERKDASWLKWLTFEFSGPASEAGAGPLQ